MGHVGPLVQAVLHSLVDCKVGWEAHLDGSWSGWYAG
jgi:hypothetical protein